MFDQAIFEAVPGPLKSAITVGIGLFIAFIGFVDWIIGTQAFRPCTHRLMINHATGVDIFQSFKRQSVTLLLQIDPSRKCLFYDPTA